MSSLQFSTERSHELYGRAVEVLPGGVNSPVRAMRQIGREPIFVARGEGAHLYDVDGNGYVDWVCSWGPLIAGHAHPAVVDAVASAASDGTSFGAPTRGELELAEDIVARIPAVEMVRMVSSGTEAAMSAIRLARAATGREQVLKFAGAYHGHVDGLLAQAGSGLATQGIPASPGVPAAAAQATVIVPWNDPDAVRAATERHELAAILAEPVPANMGVVPPAPGFLELLREQADRTGALLMFDEVITGFRVAPGGAQQWAGVLPDLTILGKIVGGGLPAAAYGGPTALMEMVAPAGDVYQAGTLSGNPLAVAAARATLELLDASAYEQLARTTDALADGLRAAARDAGIPLTVQSVPGLVTPFFTAGAVTDYAGSAASDASAYGAWCRALLERGVYPPASQFEAWFPSLAHTRADIEQTITAARAAFEALGMSLATLRDALAAEGGTVASALADTSAAGDEATPPALAASGPRAAGRRADYELLLELVLEGSLLHYGRPRALAPEDPDLALLLGDRLYALGLERLAALGDLEAVGELGELISLLAQAHLRGSGDLAAAVWEAGATAIGWGTDPALRAAQELARRQDVGAEQALLRAAANRRQDPSCGGAAEIGDR